MNEPLKVTRKFHIARRHHGRKQLRNGSAPDVPVGRVPRIAQLMALAIRCDKLIRDGVIANQSEPRRVRPHHDCPDDADHDPAESRSRHSRAASVPPSPAARPRHDYRERCTPDRSDLRLEKTTEVVVEIAAKRRASRSEFAVGLRSPLEANQVANLQRFLNRERESSRAISRKDGSNPPISRSTTKTREGRYDARVIAKCCGHCG